MVWFVLLRATAFGFIPFHTFDVPGHAEIFWYEGVLAMG